MQQTAKGRYEKLNSERTSYLNRGRECAKLTIPSLLPMSEDNTSGTKFPTPYQSMGARGVNNLASKLLLALFPPNHPFFRLNVNEFELRELTGRDDMRAEIEKALGEIERAVMSETEAQAIRVPLFEAFKHLIVVGNVLLYVTKDKGVKVFRLDHYVVKRDFFGQVMEIVVREKIGKAALPEEVLKAGDPEVDQKKPTDDVELYTWIKRDGDKFKVHQEVNKTRVPKSEGSYKIEECPWIPLRFIRIDGEDYGRSYVEEYYGDLRSLEGLSQAIVEGSAAAAKVLFLVNPNSTTEERVIAQAPNLAVRSGSAEDVTVLQLEKYADFRVALETINLLNARLAQAFLMTSAIQRDAERVTAEEVRLMAAELEDALGGVYSLMSQELQLPLVNTIMANMVRAKKLPRLPRDTVRPVVVAGLEALGRGHDLNRLMTFGQMVQSTLGPEVFQVHVNPSDFLKRLGTALGLDMNGLIRTEEEIMAMQQEAMMREQMQTLGPAAIQAQGRLAQEKAKQGEQQEG